MSKEFINEKINELSSEAMYKNLALRELEKWSEKYNISFQFWNRNNSVYISKDDFIGNQVDLYSTGGYDTINEVINAALDWIYKVNKVPYSKRIKVEA